MTTIDPILKEQYLQIASAMISTTNVGGRSYIDAGYTYIGQMLSHELVPTTSKSNSSREISGYMDLDSLYGNEAWYKYSPDKIDSPLFNSDGTFRLGKYNTFDLHRDSQGIAIIPEQLNAENIIIAPLHPFWQRLHNYLFLKYYAGNILGGG